MANEGRYLRTSVDGSEIRLATTWDVLDTAVNNGINYQAQLVSRNSAYTTWNFDKKSLEKGHRDSKGKAHGLPVPSFFQGTFVSFFGGVSCLNYSKSCVAIV